jgi:hypothetical protein
MRLNRRAALPLLVTLVSLATAVGVGNAASSAPTWTVATGPQPTTRLLDGVSAANASHAYAVGARYPTGDPAGSRAVVESWDGTTWTDMASAPAASELTSVSANSPDDIWVAGYRTGESVAVEVWHYNGRSWTAVASQGLPVMNTGKILSAGGHIWLVGEVDPGRRDTGAAIATYHAGTQPHWTVKRLADSGGFYGAAARTASDAWAVGGTSQYPGHGHAIAAHWNGKAWSLHTLPLRGSFSAVAAGGPNDAMAVGKIKTSTGGISGLAARWNGHRWIAQHFKRPGINVFTSVAAYGAKKYWASRNGVSFAEYRAHYLRYQGGHWNAAVGSRQPNADYFIQNPQMWLAQVPGTAQILAVGFAVTSGAEPQVTKRYFALREEWR